jgi:tetratricopeptide (TPR) repeat protein
VDRLRNRATRRYYLANGEFDKAWESATEGLQITTRVFRFGVGAQRILGRITRARGEFNDAERHSTQALETFASIDARFEVGRSHLALAELARDRGNPDAAAKSLHEAYRMFQALGLPRYLERTERLAQETDISISALV